jgi:hypothetical protein
MMRDPLFSEIEALWRAVDPAPEGLVNRMQVMAAAEAALAAIDFEYELMLLVERSSQLAGVRSAAQTYTLRFSAHGGELLVRVSDVQGGRARVDGWIVPPIELEVRMVALSENEAEYSAVVDEHGRFEMVELPTGIYRLWLHPADGDKPFVTPAFEV